VETELTLAPDGDTAASGSQPEAPPRRTPGWFVCLAVVLITAVLALGTHTVAAMFASTSSSSGNQFVTGSVDLTVTPGSAILSMGAMMPGDSITAPVTVTNTGGSAMRYTIKSTTSESILAGQLNITVKAGVATCDGTGFSGSGLVLYGPAALGSTTGTKLVGDPAQGAQAGDRPLAAGANEVLCLQILLPSSTDNSYLSRTTTATFDFFAEQTAGNP
jgi:hypothetical protein